MKKPKAKSKKLSQRARRKEMTGVNLAAINRRLEWIEAVVRIHTQAIDEIAVAMGMFADRKVVQPKRGKK